MQQRLGQPDDNCERSPDFMRHICKETNLRLIAFFDVFCMLLFVFQRLCQPDTLAIAAYEPMSNKAEHYKIAHISPPGAIPWRQNADAESGNRRCRSCRAQFQGVVSRGQIKEVYLLLSRPDGEPLIGGTDKPILKRLRVCPDMVG